jgi:hypothetical protein
MLKHAHIPYRMWEIVADKHALARHVNMHLKLEAPSSHLQLPRLVSRAMLKEKPEDEKPKAIIRPYTPTSAPDARGYMDLVVKVGARPWGCCDSHALGLGNASNHWYCDSHVVGRHCEPRSMGKVGDRTWARVKFLGKAGLMPPVVSITGLHGWMVFIVGYVDYMYAADPSVCHSKAKQAN